MRRSPSVTPGRTALTASFSVAVEQLTVFAPGCSGGEQKKRSFGLLSWLIGVWLTGVWLTGAFAARIGCSASWLIGVWLTGVWLTGAPCSPADMTVDVELVQSTPCTAAAVHQSVYVPPELVCVSDSGSLPSPKAIADSVPSGLRERSTSPILIGFGAFAWSGAGSGLSL